MISGVMPPSRVVTRTLAPAWIRIFAISRSSRNAAQCSAVVPSPCEPSTSALCASRLFTAARSPRIAASDSRESPAAAARTAARMPLITVFPNMDRLPTLDRDDSVAVAERVDVHHQLVRQGQMNVRHRRAFLAADMLAALDAAALARQKHRYTLVIVNVGVAQRAAIHHNRVIEQVSVAVRRILELLEEVRNQTHVIAVQARELLHLGRRFAVMRAGMERRFDSALRPHPAADVARHLERRYARGFGHERQRLKIEHQIDMLFVIV